MREPTSAQLTQLAHTIALRVGRLLEREGLLERDTEHLNFDSELFEDDPMPDLVGHSITYRIAAGPPRGVCAQQPYRARITPARRGAKPTKPAPTEDRTPAEQRAAMRWAQRLKRVFQIDVETCPNCGGTVKVIASTRDGFS